VQKFSPNATVRVMKTFVSPSVRPRWWRIPIFTVLLLTTTILNSGGIFTQVAPAQAESGEVQFVCGTSFHKESNRKVPTTIAWTPTGKVAIVQWVKSIGNYWTPERRCNEFSQRMTVAYQAGTLKFLTNSKKNGSSVICTATEVNGKCQNILMTLRPQDKAISFLSELKDVLNGRAAGPMSHSSGEPQVYIEIDMKKAIEQGTPVR
jgi:Circadian oscillating protein COP23